MPVSRQELKTAILQVLETCAEPLTAKTIHQRLLADDGFCDVTKSELSSILYEDLKARGEVELVPPLKWKIAGKRSSAKNSNRSKSETRSLITIEVSIEVTKPCLSVSDIQSIKAAISEEIAATDDKVEREGIDIDAIDRLSSNPGSFVYRLVLSSSAQFSPDQTIKFETRRQNETINGVVVRFDDEGLLVECEKPLPTDAKLLSLSFDPTFILRGLEKFILEMCTSASSIAHSFVNKEIPPIGPIRRLVYADLNHDQQLAVNEMDATKLYFLWGPPGTGKTMTIAAAAVRWLRQKKRVLIVSTSNAAVDVAMRSVLKFIKPEEKREILRLGTSLDPSVKELTIAGKLLARNAGDRHRILAAQDRLAEIEELLRNQSTTNDRRHELFVESHKLEAIVREFGEKMELESPKIMSGISVFGCTLAKMVLDKTIRSQAFDVVILDEASMSSLIYSLAASFLPSKHLVYAGDPRQLSPIARSKGKHADTWFRQNVYDWFELANRPESQTSRMRMLRTQYRMTDEIGNVVSYLSYGGALEHGRQCNGSKIQFVNINHDWQLNRYSVTEESYYHLAVIPILHALSSTFEHDDILLLSPFRSQRSLLSAIGSDLHLQNPKLKFTSSTIHRAQGYEAGTVIIDLTMHSPDSLGPFFEEPNSESLFNVAISRAKDRLIILGNKSIIHKLGKTSAFWSRVLSELSRSIDVVNFDQATNMIRHYSQLRDIPITGSNSFPAIYSHHGKVGGTEFGIELLRNTTANRKLLVLDSEPLDPPMGDYLIRSKPGYPPLFIGGGSICLPENGRWLVVDSPNASRVLWRIAFSHLAEDEVDLAQTRRFICPKCSGDLILRQYPAEGWFLACNGGWNHICTYRRRLSLKDAKLKVRLNNMTCPDNHPLTARNNGGTIYLGCENYPRCTYTERLSLLRGT